MRKSKEGNVATLLNESEEVQVSLLMLCRFESSYLIIKEPSFSLKNSLLCGSRVFML